VSTPIDQLKPKYRGDREHLKAIEDALMAQFSIDETHRAQVQKAVRAAFDVGHRTTTTDDWANMW
jgi:hypothetical protein